MKISLTNGILKIDGKEVHLIKFKDLTMLYFPIEDENSIEIDSTDGSNQTEIRGNRNTVIQGKNIIAGGGSIHVTGDFILGDR